MADQGVGSEELDDFEAILKRHKTEKKDLQAKLQAMKHSVPKGDKKRKKQVTLEAAQLEAEMEDRHKKELEEFKSSKSSPEADIVSNEVEKAEDESSSTKITATTKMEAEQRVSRSQKRKEKKAAKEREREQRIAEAEVENVNSARNTEAVKLTSQLNLNGLQIKEISPDGHCLYNAIADQMNLLSLEPCECNRLRNLAADYMIKHEEDFLPFLVHHVTGELYTAEQFAEYCNNVANTSTWGGQPEIQALSHVLCRPVDVYQADSPVLRIGEQYSSQQPLLLSYHRHAFGLGEHYNSVVPKETLSTTENDT